jgi:hypothetical protein
MSISPEKHALKIFGGDGDIDFFQCCFVSDVNLPVGFYFGFSAATNPVLL